MFGPLNVNPLKSKGAKTGTWRTLVRPHFLHKNCISCKLCLQICPEGCIYGKEKNTYSVDYNFCKGCGLCADICPKKDIEMVGEESKEEDK
ncbi:MAG: 4Fe-4S binding protein [Candidatus Omnitrophica bacterium]|nr:4Fe-4S binding protein [Candidatus Omnitrophota bacterium]